MSIVCVVWEVSDVPGEMLGVHKLRCHKNHGRRPDSCSMFVNNAAMSVGEKQSRRWKLSIQVILTFTTIIAVSLAMFRLAASESQRPAGASLFAFVGLVLVGCAFGVMAGQLW